MTSFAYSLVSAIVLALAVPVMPARLAPSPQVGVLLLAHGGSTEWDANVHAIASEVNKTTPVEVALGMATRANIQIAVDRLVARGVTSIVAVPLFVSSHSSVIASTQYLLGLRAEMPPDLAIFATMTHGGAGDHTGHGGSTTDGTKPIRTSVPVRMTPALDAHPFIGAIVASRAEAISREPAVEAVILVAHGPVPDEANEQWLLNLRAIATQVSATAAYASVDAITVRDDAPAAIRDAATRDLRQLVVRRRAEHRRVLIVPVLLSYGGIEAGIRARLEGLEHTMAATALAPDQRLVQWVLTVAAIR